MDADFYGNSVKNNSDPNSFDFRYSYDPGQILAFGDNNMKINKNPSMDPNNNPLTVSDHGYNPFIKEGSKQYN
jgi:hypothetical protein